MDGFRIILTERRTKNMSETILHGKAMATTSWGLRNVSKFLEWYESVKGQPFNFRKEIKEYCVSDVDILRQACLKFRHLLISSMMTHALVTTKKGKQKMKDVAIDPFDFVTIASVCMGLYKTKHLQEEWKVQLNGGQE